MQSGCSLLRRSWHCIVFVDTIKFGLPCVKPKYPIRVVTQPSTSLKEGVQLVFRVNSSSREVPWKWKRSSTDATPSRRCCILFTPQQFFLYYIWQNSGSAAQTWFDLMVYVAASWPQKPQKRNREQVWVWSGCAPCCFLISYQPLGSLCSLPRRHVQRCHASLLDSESKLLTQAWASSFALILFFISFWLKPEVTKPASTWVLRASKRQIAGWNLELISCKGEKKKACRILRNVLKTTWFRLPCSPIWHLLDVVFKLAPRWNWIASSTATEKERVFYW